MPTSPVTTVVSGSSFTVNVVAANLDPSSTILDYIVLVAGTLTTTPANYTKTTLGTVIQYSGVALAGGTTLEIRRRTPRVQRTLQAVGTKIRSNDWNAEFDRNIRINEEYDLYGAGGGFSVRLPLDAAFGVAWDGDTLFPPTRNAVYDELIRKSDLNGPSFAGVPTSTTVATSDNSAALATTAYVKNNLIALATIASPAFTGVPTAPNALASDNTTTLATTAHVKSNLASYLLTATASATYAPLANPALTGVPTAPTAALAVSSTQIATTQFVNRSQRPMCILERITSPVSIAAGVFVPVVFNSKIRDADNVYNSSTGVFTAPFAGYYSFSLHVRSSQTSGSFATSITTIGLSELVRVGEVAGVVVPATVIFNTVVVYLNTADTIYVCSSSSVATTVLANPVSGVRSLSGCTIHYLGNDA